MPASDGSSFEFDFTKPARVTDGYTIWHEQRSKTLALLGKQLGLPLGHRVEVWIRGEIRLEGMLGLKDEVLFLELLDPAALQLSVDNVPFLRGEISSCVRLD